MVHKDRDRIQCPNIQHLLQLQEQGNFAAHCLISNQIFDSLYCIIITNLVDVNRTLQYTLLILLLVSSEFAK